MSTGKLPTYSYSLTFLLLSVHVGVYVVGPRQTDRQATYNTCTVSVCVYRTSKLHCEAIVCVSVRYMYIQAVGVSVCVRTIPPAH